MVIIVYSNTMDATGMVNVFCSLLADYIQEIMPAGPAPVFKESDDVHCIRKTLNLVLYFIDEIIGKGVNLSQCLIMGDVGGDRVIALCILEWLCSHCDCFTSREIFPSV
jgi:hypothetical protein